MVSITWLTGFDECWVGAVPVVSPKTWVSAWTPISAAAVGSGFAIVSASDLKIGKHTSDTFSAVWDIDEFRLCNYAATEAEIKAWCRAPSAASGGYDKLCGTRARRIVQGTSGGTPTLGNSNFAHTIQGPNEPMTYVFVAGDQMPPGIDMGNAFSELSGCMWVVNFDIVILGTTNSTGAAVWM